MTLTAITGAGGAGTPTYSWRGPDISVTTSATNVSPSFTTTATAATGAYSVVVSYSGTGCGSASGATGVYSLNAQPAITSLTTPNLNPFCTGSNLVLTANGVSGGAGASVYTWSGPGISSTTGISNISPIFTPTAAIGAYSVSLAFAGTGCNTANQQTGVYTVAPTPNGTIVSGAGTFCGSTTITATDGAGGTIYFQGTTSGGTSTAIPSATQVVTVTGTYYFRSQSAAGCWGNQGSVSVTINPVPTATVTNNGYICNGGVVTLTASPIVGVTTYSWTGTSITGSASTSITTATPTSLSVYTVVITDGSGNPGCTTQYTTTVSVNATPTATASNNGYICAGGTVTLTATPAGGASVFTWIGPAFGPVSGLNVTATPTLTSTYTLTVTDGSGHPGCSPTTPYTTTVSVNATPTASPTNDGPICAGGTVHLFANPSGGVSVFNWVGAALIPVSSATVSATPTLTATYTLTVSDGSNQPGCAPSTQYTTAVTVSANPTLVNATSNSPICATSDLLLGVVGAANVTGYSWSGPVAITNPLTATASVPSAGTNASGTYTVIVNNGAGSGCTASYTTVATVNALPAVFNVTGGGGYCSDDTGVHVGLDGSESGINYQLFLGSAGGTTLSGTGSALDFGLYTAVGVYTVLATNAATFCASNMNGSAAVSVNPSPVSTYSLTSSGTDYCFGGTGVIVSLSGSEVGINYQLYLGSYPVGDDTAGTGSSISFGYETGAGDYLAIATNATTGCQSMLTGYVSIVIDSLPRLYTVTGGGGYCMGGAGIDIGLSGSDAGISYDIYNSSIIGSLGTEGGTGGSLDFGFQVAAGTVSVVATNNTTHCHSVMSGTPVISVNPLPTVYNVTGGGTYCEGTGGVNISLSTSDTGVTYSLYNGASFVTSVVGIGGGTLSFGPQTAAGTYTVSALRTFTGCSAAMADSAVIVENMAPTIYSVTGGGPYCSSDPGVAIGLGGFDTGVTYTLYNLAAPVGTFTLSASSLNFGFFPAGSYSVSAAYNFTGCMSNMSGVRTITENASPVVYGVTGGGSYCAGSGAPHVFLSSSDTGVTYSLYNDGTFVGTFTSSVSGSMLDFGSLPTAGTYTVSAANAISGCGSNMADSAVINVVTPVTPSVSVSTGIGDTSCLGSSVTFTATGVNGGATPGYSWSVNGTTVTGATSSTYIYVPANGDVVMGIMASSATCATPAAVSASDTITVLDHATPGVTISANPGSTVCANTIVTFTAVPAFGGAIPTFTWQKNGITVLTAGATYSYVPLDGDNISVEITSDYPCLIHDTASADLGIHVGADIPPVVEIVAVPGRAIHTGETDTLIGEITSGGPVTYQWLVNNVVMAGATNSTYISTFNNNDSVTCQATSTNGCALSGFNTISITVYNVGITPVVSGEANLRLIPNPNKGEFSISGTLGTSIEDVVTMEITDMLGQVIYKDKVTVHSGVMDQKIRLNNTLSNGMYILNLHSSDVTKVFHFVVEQ